MFPVSSLVLDEDVPSDIALIYPELYKDLGKVGDRYLQIHKLALLQICYAYWVASIANPVEVCV